MPYYEFQCTQCGEKFTQKQSFEEHVQGKRVKCPKCGSQKVERVVGSVLAKTSKKS